MKFQVIIMINTFNLKAMSNTTNITNTTNIKVLPPPSIEQQNIVDAFKDGHNIIVEAVAGSGKTTTSLHCCCNTDKKVLIVTYNARLKQETRNKVKQLGITNAEVHSYHALITKYYGEARTDLALRQLIRTGQPRKILNADIIIIDETQDMSLDYFMLICKLLVDSQSSVLKGKQFMIIGDPRQMIFNISKTSTVDHRFLTYSNKLYDEFINNKSWVRLSLSVSYRLTTSVANFLNSQILNCNLIKGGNTGNPSIKPNYYICDTFNCSRIITDHIRDYGTDLCILSPSIRSDRSPVMKVINALSAQGYKFYVSTDENNNTEDNEEVMKGKVLVSSFHQMKGCERRAVIVFGFDDTYFDYFARTETNKVCPNAMYVALTRAKERLSILHHYTNKPFRTLNWSELSVTTNLIEIRSLKSRPEEITVYKKESYSVTELLRHLGVITMERALNLLTYTKLDIPSDGILNIPNMSVRLNNINAQFLQNSSQDPLRENFEFVADIYGTVIPIIFEYLKQEKSSTIENILNIRIVDNSNGKNDMFDIQEKEYKDLYSKIKDKLVQIKSAYEIGEVSAEQWMFLSVIFNGLDSGYFHRIHQITDYKWINEDYIMQNVNRLLLKFRSYQKTDLKHEVKLFRQIGNTVIFGRADLSIKNYSIEKFQNSENSIDTIDTIDTIWELKCKTEFCHEDVLQLASYMALKSINTGYLYYIPLDDLYEVKFKGIIDNNRYVEYLDILLDGKRTVQSITDESFIMNTNTAKAELISKPLQHSSFGETSIVNTNSMCLLQDDNDDINNNNQDEYENNDENEIQTGLDKCLL